MTLDEAIKHAEEVAYQKDLESGFDTDNERYAMTDNERANCKKCAEEHRQLAEWLKELKQLREQTSWTSVIEKPPKDGTYHVTRKTNRGNVIGTVSYATDLYTIDKFDFADKKGKGGWYDYDSEYGYYEITESIIAWQELPEPYKESEE